MGGWGKVVVVGVLSFTLGKLEWKNEDLQKKTRGKVVVVGVLSFTLGKSEWKNEDLQKKTQVPRAEAAERVHALLADTKR